jgi:diguanylate cyclase (GGDEF)-like protein
MIWPVVLWLRVRRQLKGRKRAQVNYFLLGLSFFAVGGFVGGILVQLVGGMGFEPTLAAYFSLPWIATTFYTITRWRLFDIQLVISRTFAAFSLFVLLGALHIGMFELLKDSTGPTLAVLFSLVLIFLLVFGTALSRVVFRAMDRLFIRDKLETQQILKDSTRAMITILELEGLLKYITDTIKSTLKVEEVCIFTRAEEGVFRLRYGPAVEQMVGPDFTLRNGAISWIKETGQTLIREEHEGVHPANAFSDSKDLLRIGAELVIPMFFKGEMKGALTLGPKGNQEPYVRSDIEVLEALAAQAAIAMENARLYEEAVRDSLTGLHHHQYFQTRLVEEVERSKRYDHPLSLLMIDIDRFKNANDEHGHLVGDRILKTVARILQEGARLGDIVARYGGDEFAVLLPETGAGTAAEVANRIRRNVEGLETLSPPVTISVGVASTETSKDAAELLERADTALYRAKENGRNRVELAA